MNLENLSDEMVDRDLLELVRSERELLPKILHHLREIDRRRLFATHKCESLFSYAIRRLGYSEDQAARRISAMRLLKELPQIEEKIESGALTLSQLSKAQSVFNRERKANRVRTVEAKLDLLSQIEGSSIRETEKTLELGAYVSQPAKDKAPLEIEQFSERVQAKLKRLLDVRSHVNPASDLENLIEQLADLGLANWDQLEKAARMEQKAARVEQKAARVEQKAARVADKAADIQKSVTTSLQVESIRDCAEQGKSDGMSTNLLNDAAVPATSRVKSAVSRAIASATRRAVYLRDKGKCVNCGTSKFIEIDHRVPLALGGSNDPENLRLLCRSCNQRHAIATYGVAKMENYLRSPRVEYFAS